MARKAPTERRNDGRVTIARPAAWTVVTALGAIAGVSLFGRLVGAQEPTAGAGLTVVQGLDGGVATNTADAAPEPLATPDDAAIPVVSVQPSSADAVDGGGSPKLLTEPTCDAGEGPARPTPRTSGAPTDERLPTEVVSERAGAAVADSLAHYGLNADVGFSGLMPDLGLLLALRPTGWLHVQAGGGYNATAFGVRGGLTVRSPFLLPLSFTCEGGHYFAGDANRIVHWFSSNARDVASLRRFSYDYLNLLGGLDFAGQHFALYVRGGVTWMRTTIADFAQSVHDLGRVELQASDPRVSYRGPTFKLGMYYFF